METVRVRAAYPFIGMRCGWWSVGMRACVLLLVATACDVVSQPPPPQPAATAPAAATSTAVVPATVAATATPLPTVPPSPTPAPTSAPVPTRAVVAPTLEPTPVPFNCGDVVRTSAVLAADMTCRGDALTIEASDIVLDLGGHTLTGPGMGSPTWPRPNLTSSGVKVAGQARVRIRNGTIKAFSSAVYLNASTDSHVEDITTTGNYYGIYLGNAHVNQVSQSTFRENIYGLTLYGANNNRLVDNDSSEQTHFSPGGYGIYMYRSNDNVIVGNTFRRNENWGIWLSDSKSNVFFHNNVIGNKPQVSDDSGGNIWHDAESHEGNYWADWLGSEVAQTGIGDHPYLIWGPGGATDPYPFVRENGWRESRRRAPQSTVTPVPTRSAGGGGGVLVSVPDLSSIVAVSPSTNASASIATLDHLESNLALAGDGSEFYVVDRGMLRAISPVDGAPRRSYSLAGAGLAAGSRLQLAADRDGQHIHVLDGQRVVTIDLVDGQVVQELPYASEPVSIFPSWKHRLLMVADRRGTVDVVWVGGGKVSYHIALDGSPTGLAANRAGTRLYLAVPGLPRVAVVETEQYAVVDHVGGGLSAQRDVAVSPDGARIYVLLDDARIEAYDLFNGARVYTAAVTVGARRIVADVERIMVLGSSGESGGWLAVLDSKSGRALRTVSLPAAPGDVLALP